MEFIEYVAHVVYYAGGLILFVIGSFMVSRG